LELLGPLPASRMNLFRDALDYFMGCDHSTRTKERLENACFESVEIEFMGAFDTAFGGNDKRSGMLRHLRFADHDLPSMVKHSVHLLSLDERRYYFQCLPWDRRKNQRQTLEQIWMPGTHSDVGGVFRDTILGEIALLTMIDRIVARTSLSFDTDSLSNIYSSVKNRFFDAPIVINNELVGFWKLLPRAKRIRTDAGENQTLHLIVDHCLDAQIAWKRDQRMSRYKLHNGFTTLTYMDDSTFFPFGEAFL
jgi:Uncharacterized alpha/beta hydrolase domain (DUF2235)